MAVSLTDEQLAQRVYAELQVVNVKFKITLNIFMSCNLVS